MTALAVTDASCMIVQLSEAARVVVDAVRVEAATKIERDDYLSALVNALIGQPNPMTEKPHSATSAEKAAKEAEPYREREAACLNAECARILAWAGYERAKLSAKLAVIAAGGAE